MFVDGDEDFDQREIANNDVNLDNNTEEEENDMLYFCLMLLSR